MSRVLCVDDEPNMRRTLAANLRARGFEVDLAENGERAIELAKSKKPDVIILDLGLHGMSGLEVIRTLRHWTTIPIIVLSARDAEFV
jgi:two-component system KDP operon response regulator KdpE